MGASTGASGHPSNYVTTPPQPLPPGHSPLMSGVRCDATREERALRNELLPVQALIMRNKHSVRAGYTGESDIFAFDFRGNLDNIGVDLERGGEQLVMTTRFVRDGSIRGYIIADTVTGRDLLKVHFHGDTTSPLQRATKAFFRSPVLKWDVENAGLFTGMRLGTNLGLIREVFPDNRVFEPNIDTLTDVPRLEMQVSRGLGAQYFLAVTGVPEPVGEVRSSLLGRVAARSEAYYCVMKNLTREEAVLWMTMVVATDMKRRKSVNSKGLRAFGPFV